MNRVSTSGVFVGFFFQIGIMQRDFSDERSPLQF